VDNARRFALESLGSAPEVTVSVAEQGMEDRVLVADGLYVQQALVYILLYLAGQDSALRTIHVSAHGTATQRGEPSLILMMGRGEPDKMTLPAAQEALALAAGQALPPPGEAVLAALHLALAETMLRLQEITLALSAGRENGVWVLLQVPAARLGAMPEGEQA